MIAQNRVSNFIQTLFDYLLICFVIVSCNSIFLWSKDFHFNVSDGLVWPLLTLVLISFLNLDPQQKLVKQSIYIIVGINIFQLWFVKLRNFNDDLTPYFLKYILFISLLIIYMVNCRLQGHLFIFIERYINLTVLLAVISLFFWLLGSVLHIIKPSGKVVNDWGGGQSINSYFNLYFEPQAEWFHDLKLIRNSSIFTEAPMYAVVLLSAIIIYLFVFNRRYNWKMAFLSLAVLSSLTTSGVLIVFIIHILKFFKYSFIINLWLEKRRWTLVISTLSLVLLGVLAYVFSRNKFGSGSYNTRLDDYVAGFKAWRESVIFGHEYGEMKPIIKHMSEFRKSNTGYSNSLMLILAQGGLFWASFYLLPIFLVIYRAVEKNLHSLFYGMILLIVLLAILIFHDTYYAMFLLALIWVRYLSLSDSSKQPLL